DDAAYQHFGQLVREPLRIICHRKGLAAPERAKTRRQPMSAVLPQILARQGKPPAAQLLFDKSGETLVEPAGKLPEGEVVVGQFVGDRGPLLPRMAWPDGHVQVALGWARA